MFWADKTLLITGGTGTFGQAFAKYILAKKSLRKLIILSRDELKQHEMRIALGDHSPIDINFFIGDVRDASRLQRAFHGVDYVIHAAAMKQVPACEYNPFEAVKTNVLGSKNVIDACIDQGVQRAVLVSSDKAVNPINLYGATKLCAEKLFVHGNSYSGGTGTCFAVTRYGNVIGSRGSVIPLWREQAKTNCLTVTDPDMTRFWLTIERGVNFVAQVFELMQGGEIFVPRCPSMRLGDLANVMAPSASWSITGIRPGEKLHEVLVSEDEARMTYRTTTHYVICPSWRPPNGQGVPPEAYSSKTNPDQLTPDQLCIMLESEVK